jgi:hypothetical protein
MVLEVMRLPGARLEHWRSLPTPHVQEYLLQRHQHWGSQVQLYADSDKKCRAQCNPCSTHRSEQCSPKTEHLLRAGFPKGHFKQRLLPAEK